MNRAVPEHTLEFLLAFDGRKHHYPDGYFVKFDIKRIEPTSERPHGLRYSFTLHGPDGARLIGFDNAHTVVPVGGRYAKKPVEADHWHRSADDLGRPYQFVSAEQLVDDFFDEVERVLTERGIELTVIATEERKIS
jgi:hypothetical protein